MFTTALALLFLVQLFLNTNFYAPKFIASHFGTKMFTTALALLFLVKLFVKVRKLLTK